jgi:hypothetical protein
MPIFDLNIPLPENEDMMELLGPVEGILPTLSGSNTQVAVQIVREESTNIQFEPRGSRKRGRLDMVKCDKCRKDRKKVRLSLTTLSRPLHYVYVMAHLYGKCGPVGRKWPEKCDRCKVSGWECSQGRRADRKKQNRGPESTVGNTGTVDIASTINPLPSAEIRDW